MEIIGPDSFAWCGENEDDPIENRKKSHIFRIVLKFARECAMQANGHCRERQPIEDEFGWLDPAQEPTNGRHPCQMIDGPTKWTTEAFSKAGCFRRKAAKPFEYLTGSTLKCEQD
jgi:hypothetical protein